MIGSSYINFFGYFPELLYLAEFLIEVLVDYVFYKVVDRKIESYVMMVDTLVEEAK